MPNSRSRSIPWRQFGYNCCRRLPENSYNALLVLVTLLMSLRLFHFLDPRILTTAGRFQRIRIAFTVSTPQPWRSSRNLPIRPSPASSPLLPPPLGRWSPPPAWKPCRAGPILWRPQGRPGRSRCIRRSTTLLAPSVASPAAASLTWPLPRSTLSSAICK